jgi:anti-anti-sigma regulatory factor
MSEETQKFFLPASANHDSCVQLAETLTNARGSNVEIDASTVEQFNARAAQLLIIASRSWTRESLSFRVVNPSQKFREAVTLLGLSGELVEEGNFA